MVIQPVAELSANAIPSKPAFGMAVIYPSGIVDFPFHKQAKVG
jgi:hypothetical protein